MKPKTRNHVFAACTQTVKPSDMDKAGKKITGKRDSVQPVPTTISKKVCTRRGKKVFRIYILKKRYIQAISMFRFRGTQWHGLGSNLMTIVA